MKSLLHVVLPLMLAVANVATARPAEPPPLPEPKPLAPGARVVTLFPPGHPALKRLEGHDRPEEMTMSKSQPGRAQSVVNVHNPSIEVHLAPPDKANGAAILVIPGGGNRQLVVGTEGIDDASHARQTVDFYNAWFNAKVPVELHVYAHGGHGNGIKPRGGIPFGSWPSRFVEWATDLGMMKGK